MLLNIELSNSFLIGRKRKVNFRNQRLRLRLRTLISTLIILGILQKPPPIIVYNIAKLRKAKVSTD